MYPYPNTEMAPIICPFRHHLDLVHNSIKQ